MFLSRIFKRKSDVVERVEQYIVNISAPAAAVPDPRAAAAQLKQELKRHTLSPGEHRYTSVMFPTSVEGCLLADQFEHQLKRRGLA